MCSLVINDIFNELRKENERLSNDLLFSHKILSEIKCFVKLIWDKYDKTFDIIDTHLCKKLVKEAEDVLDSNKTSKNTNRDNTSKESPNSDESDYEIGINSLQPRDNRIERSMKEKLTIEAKEEVIDDLW